jgi:hypothetical protein
MTDTSEPWPPVPGTGPVGPPGTGPVSPSGNPPPVSVEPPQAFPPVSAEPTQALPPPQAFPPAQPDWFQQAPSTPPPLEAGPAPVVPLPADQVGVAPAPPAAPRRRRGGLVLIVAFIIVGLAGVLGGGALLAKELTRKATHAEQAAALAKEIASRWQRLPAGKIFPTTVSYTNGDNVHSTATRVGIVPSASCKSALEPSAFQQIRPYGCAEILRATYVDAAGTQAVTVGIAVFPSAQAAEKAQGALEAANVAGGLYAVPIAGTITDTFGNAQRGTGDAQFAGAYVVLYTAGYTDGMPGSVASTNDELGYLGQGALSTLEPILTTHTSPCTMKDIKC